MGVLWGLGWGSLGVATRRGQGGAGGSASGCELRGRGLDLVDGASADGR